MSSHGTLVRELIHRKSRWVKTAWINLIERRSLKQAFALHVTSRVEALEISALGLKSRNLAVVPNGVDWTDDHSPLEKGPFANVPRPYALFLSRINWKKGLDRLIAAWAQVPALNLVIAGNDEDDYVPKLRRLVASAGLDLRVHFAGPVADDQKWALYRNAEMFVLPSYNENFGIVVAEAMAMACPVVVTPGVGLSDVILESGAGIVASGEPKIFAEAVCKLYDDLQLRREMGKRGRRVVIDALSWDAVAGEMEALYINAANRNSIGQSDQDRLNPSVRKCSAVR